MTRNIIVVSLAPFEQFGVLPTSRFVRLTESQYMFHLHPIHMQAYPGADPARLRPCELIYLQSVQPGSPTASFPPKTSWLGMSWESF